jgi:hypothetical protein
MNKLTLALLCWTALASTLSLVLRIARRRRREIDVTRMYSVAPPVTASGQVFYSCRDYIELERQRRAHPFPEPTNPKP